METIDFTSLEQRIRQLLTGYHVLQKEYTELKAENERLKQNQQLAKQKIEEIVSRLNQLEQPHHE